MFKNLFRLSVKAKRNLYLIFFLMGLVVVALNVVSMVEAIERKDNFTIFRRIVYIVVFGLITVDYFIRYRKIVHQIRAGAASNTIQER
jgi:hypothetical protein